MGERVAMRVWGRRMFVAGLALVIGVSLVYFRARHVHDTSEFRSGATYDVTPFVMWVGLGALVLLVGAMFFAAGEAVRLLRGSTAPGHDRGAGGTAAR